MRVLITGGTGLLGRHLVPALQQRGHVLRMLALPDENTGWLDERHIDVYRGDIRQAETLADPMQGVDAVIHMAAMMGVWRPLEDYRAVNVGGTENVCRAVLKAGVGRMVHISSWTVYGMNLGRPATEDMPLAPLKEPYALTKAEGDLLVQQLIKDEGLPAVIVRPGTFFGPGDRLHFGRIADRIRAGSWITIGSGTNALPFVYVTDVVQGLTLALERECAAGRAYNITNDRPMTQSDMWSAIADEISSRPPRLRVPYLPIFAAGYAAEQVAKLTRAKRQPPVTRLGVMLFGGDNRHSIEKARHDLGFVPAVELRDGISLAAEWYRTQAQN